MSDLTTLTLPVLPLSSGVVLPGMVVTIAVETPEARAGAEAAGDGGQVLLVPRVDGRYATVGVVARVEQSGTLPGGNRALVVRAEHRARLGSGVVGTTDALWLQADPVTEADAGDEARRLGRELKLTLKQVLEHIGGRRFGEALNGLDEPAALADAAGWWPDLSLARKVELLETVDVTERVTKVLGWAKEALADLELAEQIRTDVSDGMERQQRDFLLRRQMDAIRKELGEDGDEDAVAGYRERLAALDGAPDHVRAAVEREIGRLERTNEQAMEHGWIRTWLDTVLDLPWGSRTTDHLDLHSARDVLDADHHGLDEVKERIVEHLAVRKLRAERGVDAGVGSASDQPDASATSGRRQNGVGSASDQPDASATSGRRQNGVGSASDQPDASATSGRRQNGVGSAGDQPDASATSGRRQNGVASTTSLATVIALVGPPGVGKTSLGASIARALDRNFVRVALGGVRDEAEIRGHRRTYVGAQPGRIVRALTEAGSMNPVFLLDEVDKVGADWRGDPSAALLEVLDPAQNHSFRDHYLEVDLDLSDVIFIATANTLDTIPAPLLDRMEVVRLDGYTEDEKAAIARDHLLPRQIERTGLTEDEVAVDDAALHRIVADYTREAGVRGLERQLGKLLRKLAVRIGSAGDSGAVSVGVDDVQPLLGKPRFFAEVAERPLVPGVAAGLAVTGAGGDLLFVEATAMPLAAETGEPSLLVTGQLGDVMQESAQIALSYVRSQREVLGLPIGADARRFHVHFPAGAVPKDGPSAGITMTTALVSLLSGRAVRREVAMTGEVTLQGRVLPIGGVKQKVLAAHRAGVTEVILPARNGVDLDDVPEKVREQLTFHLVDDVADVVRIALVPQDKNLADAA